LDPKNNLVHTWYPNAVVKHFYGMEQGIIRRTRDVWEKIDQQGIIVIRKMSTHLFYGTFNKNYTEYIVSFTTICCTTRIFTNMSIPAYGTHVISD
jgi:hypothetical protein